MSSSCCGFPRFSRHDVSLLGYGFALRWCIAFAFFNVGVLMVLCQVEAVYLSFFVHYARVFARLSARSAY